MKKDNTNNYKLSYKSICTSLKSTFQVRAVEENTKNLLLFSNLRDLFYFF